MDNTAFDYYRKLEEKFDFYILGILVAICAFLGKTFFVDATTVRYTDLITISLFGLSTYFGFKRIETLVIFNRVNSKYLNKISEKDALLKIRENLPQMHTPTGVVITTENYNEYNEKLDVEIKIELSSLQKLRKNGMLCYQLRNWFAVMGFIALIAARFFFAK